MISRPAACLRRMLFVDAQLAQAEHSSCMLGKAEHCTDLKIILRDSADHNNDYGCKAQCTGSCDTKQFLSASMVSVAAHRETILPCSDSSETCETSRSSEPNLPCSASHVLAGSNEESEKLTG